MRRIRIHGHQKLFIGRMREGEGAYMKTKDREVRLEKGGYTHF